MTSIRKTNCFILFFFLIAHVLMLDISQPFNHDVLVNLYQSLTDFFSLVTQMSGPSRVPLFGLTTIGQYAEVIYKLKYVESGEGWCILSRSKEPPRPLPSTPSLPLCLFNQAHLFNSSIFHPQTIFPLQPIKGNFPRLHSVVTEFKRSAMDAPMPTFEPGTCWTSYPSCLCLLTQPFEKLFKNILLES